MKTARFCVKEQSMSGFTFFSAVQSIVHFNFNLRYDDFMVAI